MRKTIFKAVAQRIREAVPEIRHVSLWNEHMAEITKVTAWPTPSVFVQFEEYQVRHCGQHVYQADVPVVLHIVTRAKVFPAGYEDSRLDDALEYFALIDRVHVAMSTLSGENFSTLMLTTSSTNHNHDELLESIERFVTRAQFTEAARKGQAVTVAHVKITEKE